MWHQRVFSGLSFLVGLAFFAGASAAETAGPEIDLLAGMEGWCQEGGGPGSFELHEGTLRARWTRQEPALLLTRNEYENFVLDLEFRAAIWCEAGLLLHAPSNAAWRAGQVIALGDPMDLPPNRYNVGAISGHLPARVAAARKYGEWNRMVVEMDWPRLRVQLNDQLIQHVDLADHPDLRHGLRRGSVGIQNQGTEIEFRRLRLRPLPDTEKAVRMFNGRDLAGWTEVVPGASWKVEDGILRACDGDGYLQHERVLRDFDLRMQVRTTPAANGGIYFRWLALEPFEQRGHEIQILDVPGVMMPTGSIYALARSDDTLLTPGRWQLIQTHVRGRHAVVHINGVKAAQTDGLPILRDGHITLQMHREGTCIEYREMYLVPADAAGP